MKEKSRKNKVIFYLVNIFIIIAVSSLTIFNIINENGVETFSYIKNVSAFSIVILTSMFFINYYLEGVVMSLAIKEYKKDFKPSYGFVIQSIGGLFSAITPLKVGYVPSIAYTYSRFNVKGEEVIKTIAKTSYTYQIWNLILSVIAFLVCTYKRLIITIGEVDLNLKYVAIIGLIYNVVLIVGYLILVLSPQFHKIVINILSWILHKLKKISNREEYINEKEEKMAIIRKEIAKYFKNFRQFIKIFMVYIVKSLLYGSLPYVVYLLISKQSFQIELWLYTIILGNLISYITSIIPIPGASGAAEIVFISTFSLIFTPVSILNSVMLVWRLFSYFLSILVGFIVFFIMINIKKSKE